MTNTSYEQDMLNVLTEIHDRLGEISKFLEICTAKFAHIDAYEMLHIKMNTPTINTDNLRSPELFEDPLFDDPEAHCVGFDNHYGLHFMTDGDRGRGFQPLARKDHNREVPLDEYGNFVKEPQEAHHDH